MARLYIGYDRRNKTKNAKLAKEFGNMYGKARQTPGGHAVVVRVPRIKNPNGKAADLLVDEVNVDMKKPRFRNKIWLDEVTA